MRVRATSYYRLGMKHKQSAPSSVNSPNATYNAEPPPRLAAEQKEKGHAVSEHVPKRLKRWWHDCRVCFLQRPRAAPPNAYSARRITKGYYIKSLQCNYFRIIRFQSKTFNMRSIFVLANLFFDRLNGTIIASLHK